MPAVVINAYSPKGSVRLAVLFVAISGHKNEFQLAMAFRSPIVASAGFAMGTIMRHR